LRAVVESPRRRRALPSDLSGKPKRRWIITQ
jgi:hypothetical protein